MPFTLNENSYITAAEADAYIADSFLSADSQRTAWEALNSSDKETYLMRAAQEVESLKYVGVKADKKQKMAFPRKYILHEEDDVPDAVKKAQALEAAELLSPTSDTDMARAYAGNVRSYSLGSISENLKTSDTYCVKAVIKSVRAQRLLLPYLGGGYRVR